MTQIELRPVTSETVRAVCALSVRDDQRAYVAANALSMAQAHFEPTAVFHAVHRGEDPVGFIQWRNANTPGVAELWRFMIDQAHQSLGLGGQALRLALAKMTSSGFITVETSVVLGPVSPLKFYLSQGFVEAHQTTPCGEWLLSRRL